MFPFFKKNKKRKKIGLALSGGNAWGLAHIGVIKALCENNIPIDFIVGTSAGSLLGGFYSFLGNIESLEKIFQNIGYKELLNILIDPFAQNGLVKGDKFLSFLEKNFNGVKMEDLSIPFQASVTDFVSGDPYFLDSGSLSLAIRASSSIPLFFEPVKIENKLFVDGGFSTPVPVKKVREMGADFIIAVNLYENGDFNTNKNKNLISMARSSIDLLFKNLAKENIKTADVVISPKLPDYNRMDFVKSKEFIEFGYTETIKLIPEIKKLINS